MIAWIINVCGMYMSVVYMLKLNAFISVNMHVCVCVLKCMCVKVCAA